MKESYGEGPASHPGPEPCAESREGVGEALAGETTGGALSREITQSQEPTQSCCGEGEIGRRDIGRAPGDPGAVLAPWHVGKLHAPDRGDLASDLPDGGQARAVKDAVRTPAMHGREESHRPVVPEKRSNKAGPRAAESVEERGLAKGNPPPRNAPETQSSVQGAPNELERIRLAAQKDRRMKFTALLHHVTVERLRAAYEALNPKAAPGVDGRTWQGYGKELEANLQSLHGRVQRGAYRAKPSRRAYIPKPDGGQRPLGIATLEDKIVQRAVVEVLTPIYEVDFAGFSYGFRPGRGAHDALDALAYGITRGKVNEVLEADIRGYFDAIPPGPLLQYIERRIGDPRILCLIRRWLRAGVLEEGQVKQALTGTPQGSSISPLLANIYLHYAFDTWAHAWRRRNARGEVVIVRYADDFVVGFQYREDAERFLQALRERFASHGLQLHPEKTRLIEFGRYARERRSKRGEGAPETFDFLGFTHICAVSRKRGFILRRHTIAGRFRRALQRIKEGLHRRQHSPVPEVGKWLGAVLRGYYNYHGVRTNLHRLQAFRREVARMWLQALQRRSQKDGTTWADMQPRLAKWLPTPRYVHPWPELRMQARLT